MRKSSQSSFEKRALAKKLGWDLKSSRQVYANAWIQMFEDKLAVQGRGPVTYGWYRHEGGVLVVPVLEDGRVLLIRQYRYPGDAWCYEVPAGGLHGRKVLEVARQELLEECGAVAKKFKRVAHFQPNTALAQERLSVVLATGVRIAHPAKLESSEFIQTKIVTAQQALRWARNGKMQDGKSALAVLMCEPQLSRLL